MIFGLIRAARMLPAPKGGVDPQDVKPTPVGPFVVWSLVGIIGFITALSWSHGVTPLITPLAILMGLLILGGILTSAFSAANGQSRSLRSLPDPEPPPYVETLNLRADIERRVAANPGLVKASVAVLDPPVVKAPPAPAPPRTRVTSRKQMVSEADLNKRMVRIAQIMIAECPVCTAKEAVFCTFQPGQRVTVLDRERGIIVHDARIGNALKTHTAKVTEVLAQFEGKIPESVWRFAL